MSESTRKTLRKLSVPLAAFALPFLVYSFTLAPTIYHLDSAELTTAAATLGLMRSTGYPVYILLGRVWAWLPLGDMGYRLNLFSAFNGALTIVLAERVLYHLKVNPWARLGALGSLAFSYFFWTLSLVAEVYTLHTALMAAIILALLAWTEKPSSPRLALVAFWAGLSLGNHLSTVLLLPACAFYVTATQPRRVCRWQDLTAGALGFAIGLSVYVYLPLRFAADPVYNYAGQYDGFGKFHPVNLQTWPGFWWLVSGQRFESLMFAYRGADLWPQIGMFGKHLWQAFLAIGLGPGMVGLIISTRRNWRFGVMAVLIFLGHATFYINYGVPDKELMFLPNYVIWALWIAVGYDWLLDFLLMGGQGSHQSTSQCWRWAQSFLLLPAFAALALNWSQVDLSDDWSARQRGESVFARAAPNALIVGHWDIVPPLEYLQKVEGQRPDVQLISRFLISTNDLEKLIRQQVHDRPVYVDFRPENLFSDRQIQPVGPLYRLLPEQ